MIKKALMLSAVMFAFSAMPVLAQNANCGGPSPAGTCYGSGDGKLGAKMFEQHDLNGDGVIDHDEFIKNAEERFGKMDSDGDGKVSKEEAKAMHLQMRQKQKEWREKKMEMKDQKRDMGKGYSK